MAFRPGRSRTSRDTATTIATTSPSSTLARRRMRARRNQPVASAATRIAVFTSSVTPYDVFQSCERCSSSNDARTTPVTPSSTTPPAASVAARRGGASRTSTTPSSAPTHAAAPRTCSTSATRLTRFNPRSSACPETDGTIERPSASASAGRSARRSSVAAPASDATTTAAMKPAPSAVPARVEPDAGRLLRSAERREDGGRRKRERDPLVADACDEREERDADGCEHARKEEPTRGDVPCGRLCRFRGERGRHGPPEADRGCEYARFEMAVVGDHRPAHGVRTVRERPTHRHDEGPAVLDVRVPDGHRPAAVRIASIPGPV